MVLGKSITRTCEPRATGGKLRSNLARTTPLLPCSFVITPQLICSSVFDPSLLTLALTIDATFLPTYHLASSFELTPWMLRRAWFGLMVRLLRRKETKVAGTQSFGSDIERPTINREKPSKPSLPSPSYL